MKTIGLIGGMSWESTQLYTQHINRGVAKALGGLSSAKIVMVSVNFAEIAYQQRSGAWDALAGTLLDCARRLERAGADCALICTNTMHKVAPQVQAGIRIPLLHIAEATCTAIRTAGINGVGLLGTRFTMEESFLRDAYGARGVQCIVPDEGDRDDTHRIIFDELCRGNIVPTSRARLRSVSETLVRTGAQGIVLGCTELTLSLKPADVRVPLFDSTELHAQAAVAFALDTSIPAAIPLRDAA